MNEKPNNVYIQRFVCTASKNTVLGVFLQSTDGQFYWSDKLSGPFADLRSALGSWEEHAAQQAHIDNPEAQAEALAKCRSESRQRYLDYLAKNLMDETWRQEAKKAVE